MPEDATITPAVPATPASPDAGDAPGLPDGFSELSDVTDLLSPGSAQDSVSDDPIGVLLEGSPATSGDTIEAAPAPETAGTTEPQEPAPADPSPSDPLFSDTEIPADLTNDPRIADIRTNMERRFYGRMEEIAEREKGLQALTVEYGEELARMRRPGQAEPEPTRTDPSPDAGAPVAPPRLDTSDPTRFVSSIEERIAFSDQQHQKQVADLHSSLQAERESHAAAVADQNVRRFVSDHPDFETHRPAIVKEMTRGTPLDVAYELASMRAAGSTNGSVQTERDALAQRCADLEVQLKQKATTAVPSSGTGGGPLVSGGAMSYRDAARYGAESVGLTE